MLTTGILSLNIHDSLTYEGVEMCLNPDLLGLPKTTARTVAAVSSDVSGEDQHRGIGSSSTNSGNSGGTTSQHSTNTPLVVGDMVEIRVWDPLPKEAAAAVAAAAAKSPSSSLMKKTLVRQSSQQQSPLTTAIPITSSSSTVAAGFGSIGEGQNIPKGGPNLTVPFLHARAEAFPPSMESETKDIIENLSTVSATPNSIINTGEALQMGVAGGFEQESSATEKGANSASADPTSSPPLPPPATSSNEAASSSATAAAISNTEGSIPPIQQSLPPVFPRVRTGTVDNQLPSTTATTPSQKPPKPSMIHRRAVSSTGAIPTRSPKQQHPPSSRHVREISDMTVDTHQLDIAGALIHQTDSHDLLMGNNDDMTESANEASLSKITSTHRLRLSFVLKATEKTFTSFKGNSRTQISMLRQVAELYNLSTYDLVTVHKIESQDEEEVLKAVSADFVVVTIKDQFISRGDMLLFQTQLVGSWIYEGQRLTESTRGIKAHAREIRHGNYSAKSGIVTEKTMITFRSRSARIIWLVQLSEEMVSAKEQVLNVRAIASLIKASATFLL